MKDIFKKPVRLIDANAIDERFTNLRWTDDGELNHWGDRKDWCLHGHEIEKLIDECPTIDAVPVVRCKECKHNKNYGCTHLRHGRSYIGITEDFFCADGERRADE